MNEWDRLHRQAERYKAEYPPGTRIMLLSMGRDINRVEDNTRGTVKAVDDVGTLHCAFDNGRSLGVIPGEDSFRKLTDEEIAEVNGESINMKKALLCIDKDVTFVGYIKGERWNGYECPLFTKDEAERICQEFSDGKTIDLSYDEERDRYIAEYIEEGITDEFEGKDFEINGEIKHLYPIGSGEWTWSKVDDPVEEEDQSESEDEDNALVLGM